LPARTGRAPYCLGMRQRAVDVIASAMALSGPPCAVYAALPRTLAIVARLQPVAA
jgi:hypothetical protein